MKKTTLLVLSIILSVSVWGQGINFMNYRWKDVLKAAAETGKPIMVDLYTTWCAPCKNMNDKVFVQKKVGTYFNEHFICCQYDAEAGYGADLAMLYEVKAYPTYLFFKPDGQLFARTMGQMPAQSFIDFAQMVFPMSAENETLSSVEKHYRSDKANPDVLYDLVRYQVANGHSATVAFDAYLKLLPDSGLVTQQVANLYKMVKSKVDINSYACDYLSAHQKELTPYLDKPADFYLKEIALLTMYRAAQKNDKPSLDRAIEVYGEDPPTPRSYLKDFFYMDYYINNKSLKNFTGYARRYYNDFLMGLQPGKQTMTGSLIASLFTKGTSFVLKYSKDTCLLREAQAWANRAVEVAPEQANARYVASNLLYKRGEKDRAMTMLRDLLEEYKDRLNDPLAISYRETLQKMYEDQVTW